MYTIATLDDLRRHLGLSANDRDADQDLLHKLVEASQLIESLTQRRFCPRLERLTVPLLRELPATLLLPGDLLELRAASHAGRALDLRDVLLLPYDRESPATMILLPEDMATWYDPAASRTITLEGIWGWHDRWSQAWRASGETISGDDLTASATSISVNDAAGSDALGFSPRFQPGQLLRIEDEYLRLTAIDAQNQRLTVLRGVQGTVAASHATGAAIETYQPSAPIRDLTLRYAELMLKSRQLLADEPSPLLRRLRRLTA